MKELTFQRDILGILVAHSYQYNSGIDIDSVLCYPLAPVSVPRSTPGGSIRKTVKSKPFKAAMSDLSLVTDEALPCPDRLRTFFLDLAAAVRTIVGIKARNCKGASGKNISDGSTSIQRYLYRL